MQLNIISLIIIVSLLGAQVLRSFLGDYLRNTKFIRIYELRNVKFLFSFSVIIVFALLFYQSYLQYQAWISDEFSKHFLPPYQSISYFVFYVAMRFFAPYLISLAAALIFLFFAKKINKKYEERFFEPEEPWFGALAFFLLSHPGWLFYFVFIILIYFIVHLLLLAISRKSLVISLYYLWLPTAIFVILMQEWLTALPLWKMMII